jgi:predicted O-methyltransferase YrrM
MASEARWDDVDRYIVERLLGADPVLDDVLAANAEAGLPPIDVTPNQGQLLALFARMVGARAILEVGTLGGYSTIWLARALPPGGRLVTLEVERHHAEVARRNLARAGVSELVEVRLGPAAESLAALVAEGAGPFDLVFIDADKPSNALYLARALELSRPGSAIVVDNVVRGGAVVDATRDDPDVAGTRATYEWLAAEPRVRATAIQTVGAKGHDGFALALVT